MLTMLDGKLSLVHDNFPNYKPLSITLEPHITKQAPLAKAFGLHKKTAASCRMTIIDATAGFAQDAVDLAALGCKVTLIEKSPLIGALLQDALTRAPDSDLSLILADSTTVLANLAAHQYPDAVYLDPMFPAHNKRALPKGKMQILRELLAATSYTNQQSANAKLLQLALQVAKQRVVVKRGLHTPPLTQEHTPSFNTRGKMCRFDVYLT